MANVNYKPVPIDVSRYVFICDNGHATRLNKKSIYEILPMVKGEGEFIFTTCKTCGIDVFQSVAVSMELQTGDLP
jgi:hypothetical protein